MKALKNIESIKQELGRYYEMSFDNETGDYLDNKVIKQKLQQLIINQYTDKEVVRQVLLLLAENTGCAEDHEIAEEILNLLHDKKYIDQKDLDFFYQNVATGRWC
ncbi:hypothetical protein [Pedobacter duraquae]|nr:hypothetical protein [Pedobacter duraquae]